MQSTAALFAALATYQNLVDSVVRHVQLQGVVVILRLMVVVEHTSWLEPPRARLPHTLSSRCSPPTPALRQQRSRDRSAPSSLASPRKSRKASALKSPVLRAQRERPRSFCEIWMTVYSDHELVFLPFILASYKKEDITNHWSVILIPRL